MMRQVFLGAALVAAVGCVHVSQSVVDHSRKASPIAPEDVYVYLAAAGDELPAACRRVAILQGSAQEAPWSDQGDIIDEMREEAGELGANALYVQSIEEPDTDERILQALFAIPADTDVDGQAVWCPQETIEASRGSGA